MTKPKQVQYICLSYKKTEAGHTIHGIIIVMSAIICCNSRQITSLRIASQNRGRGNSLYQFHAPISNACSVTDEKMRTFCCCFSRARLCLRNHLLPPLQLLPLGVSSPLRLIPLLERLRCLSSYLQCV